VGTVRILSGRLRDPVVGKELLAGVCVGCAAMGLVTAFQFASIQLGQASELTLFPKLEFTIHPTAFVAFIALNISSVLLLAFMLASFCVFVRLAFRRIRFEAMVALLALLLATITGMFRPETAPWFAPVVLFCVVVSGPIILARIGFLSICTAGCTMAMLADVVPLHWNRWYTPLATGMFVLPAMVALFGFVTSQGGLAKLAQYFDAADST
jgi:hypothetical protein